MKRTLRSVKQLNTNATASVVQSENLGVLLPSYSSLLNFEAEEYNFCFDTILNEEAQIENKSLEFMMKQESESNQTSKVSSPYNHDLTESRQNSISSENQEKSSKVISSEVKQNVISLSKNRKRVRLTKPSLFQNIINVLRSWYENPIVQPDLQGLSKFELELTVTIIRRKLSQKNGSLTSGYLSESLLSYFPEQNSKSSKRTEENNKFVLKHTLKLMKKEFFKKRQILSSVDADEQFFQYYFGDTQMLKEGSKSFGRNLGSNCGSLSISQMRKILEVKKFSVDFFNFLKVDNFEKNLLVTSYSKTIPRKLKKLFKKWEKPWVKQRKATRVNILDYFRNNSQCKLPWTNREVISAVSQALQSIPM